MSSYLSLSSKNEIRKKSNMRLESNFIRIKSKQISTNLSKNNVRDFQNPVNETRGVKTGSWWCLLMGSGRLYTHSAERQAWPWNTELWSNYWGIPSIPSEWVGIGWRWMGKMEESGEPYLHPLHSFTFVPWGYWLSFHTTKNGRSVILGPSTIELKRAPHCGIFCWHGFREGDRDKKVQRCSRKCDNVW